MFLIYIELKKYLFNLKKNKSIDMKKIILFISFLVVSCNSNVKEENPIRNFQRDLVENGITGSNAAMVYQNGEVIYDEIINSGAIGDADIDENTIFAIHSMSKTVTTVAMMILLENNLYEKLRIKLRDINDFIKFWDQDVLNSFFNGNYYELDNSMNYDPNIYQENNLNEKPEKIIFLHYQGSNKPWTVNGVFGEYSKFYHQYFNKYGLGDYHITSTWKKVAFFQFLKNIISLNFLRLSNPFKYLTSVISYLIDKK